MIELKEIADGMSSKDIVLAYQGKLDSGIVDELLSFSESILIERQVDKKLKKKVFIILVEALQNSSKHQIMAPSGKPLDFTVALKVAKEGFTLLCGNYITSDSKRVLLERIEEINGLSEEELSKLYLTTLDNGVQSDVGGSGLGLMEIARKSGNKIDYNFQEVEENKVYFTMQVNITK